jgi:hypothetical protein
MGDKKQKTKNVSAWKPILVISSTFIVLVVLLFGWLYFANKPNYRDLQKEFNQLNIPADWELVSESSNKGVLGMFCWQIEGEECPYSIYEYSVSENISSNPEKIFETLYSILSSGGFRQEDNSYGLKCSESDIKSGNYLCYVVGLKNKVELSVTISDKSKTGEKGSWAKIGLSTSARNEN